MKSRFSRVLLSLACFYMPASAATVIVNEINCATSSSTPSGDWFEVVVVGDGTWSSTVDMRGWQFRVDNNGLTQQGYFRLSNNVYWSNLRAGTIITFCEDNTGPSGAPTSILGSNFFNTQGWGHTNIWVGDSTYVDTSWGSNQTSYPIDQNNTQILIQDSQGTTVFGPAGEGHTGYPGAGVSSTEICQLQADPSPSVTLTSPYDDATTATFGAPNRWTTSVSPQVQNFTAFTSPIPEPSSSLLALVGIVMFSIRRRES